MNYKTLAKIALSLCLVTQLNFASAEKNYDEEITLPLGTNFDLEMEEITRYEYDGNYVKAQTVNGKEQFILQKTGDTIITVIMEENGQKTEMRVLVHIVTENQFNGVPNTASKTTTPATTKPSTPATTTTPAATVPATTTAPAATAPTTSTTPAKTTTPAATAPATTTTPAATTAPAATAPATSTTPAKTTAPAATAPATTPVVTTPNQAIKPTVTTKTYGVAATRPTETVAANSIDANRIRCQNLAFDVLDLVNSERTKQGLKPLVMAKDLLEVATVRAKELPMRFSHIRPNNTRYTTAVAIQGTILEENIAAGQTTAEAVVKAWMAASTSHDIIMNPNLSELGVGYIESAGSSYNNYWVQIFRG